MEQKSFVRGASCVAAILAQILFAAPAFAQTGRIIRTIPLPSAASRRNSASGAEINSAQPVERPAGTGAMADLLALIGTGMDSTNGRLKAICLDGEVGIPQPNAQVGTTFLLQLVQTSAEFDEMTRIEAQVDGGFGSWSASVKSSLEKDHRESSKTSYLYVSVKSVITPAFHMTNLRAAPGLTADPVKFLAECGDSFIESVSVGGELTAMLRYSFKSSADKTAFDLSFSAGGFGVNSSSSLKSVVTSASSNTSVSVNMRKVGSAQRLPDSTVEGLVAAAQNLPTEINSNTGNVVTYATKPYFRYRIPGAGDYTDSIDVVRELDSAIARLSVPAYTGRSYFIKDGNKAARRISLEQIADLGRALRRLRDTCRRQLMNDCDIDALGFQPANVRLIMAETQ